MTDIKIGLLGLGTVGSGVVNILRRNRPQIAGLNLRVTRAAVRNLYPKRQELYPEIDITTDSANVVSDPDIDIIVEVMGGVDTTYPLLVSALKHGKHVISANKDLLAKYGTELTAIAQANHVGLYYEAAVMGSIPILHTLQNAYAGDTISRVAGIANGTSNFILTQMVREGRSYKYALKLAQELNFAEADPTNDVEGFDASFKLLILSRFAFGMNPTMADIQRQGITTLSGSDFAAAKLWGYTIKPLATASLHDEKLSLSVSPQLVPIEHPLSAVLYENNAVMVDSVNTKQITLTGPGAGSLPTANSVIADLFTIGTFIQNGLEPRPFVQATNTTVLSAASERVAQRFVVLRDHGEATEDELRALGLRGKIHRGDGTVFILTKAISDVDVNQITDQIASATGLQLVHILPVFE